MPVLDDEGRILGVVTEIDLLEAIKEGKSLSRTTAGEIMTKGAVTADVDAPLSKLIATMKEKNILRLFITAQGKLAGIVARVDILKSQIEPEFYVL
jgi:CBS domain-containing protein